MQFVVYTSMYIPEIRLILTLGRHVSSICLVRCHTDPSTIQNSKTSLILLKLLPAYPVTYVLIKLAQNIEDK